jgi:outer membrane protein assembly factor BamA
MHFEPGQPADAVQFGKDADSIKALYGSRGYMDASVQTTPELDNASHTVAYRLIIHEGEIFKMGELEILGVDPRTKDRLQNNWTLLSGDTYNSAYTRRFVSQALKDVLTTGEWTSDIQETVDRKDKTVDVTLRFIAR